MAAVSTEVLTHLDPLERYAAFEDQFDERVYPSETSTVVNDRIRRNTVIYGEKTIVYCLSTQRPYTVSVYDRIAPYTDTEIYDRNTGPCNTTKYDRIRRNTDRVRSFTSVYGFRNHRPGYIRFTIPEQCLTHVQIHAGSSQRQVYFFLPDFETRQLSRPIHGFNGTRIYIYCIDEESVLSNRNTFGQRALYNIFNSDRIEFQLNAAQLELLYELKLKAPRGSAEHDQWASLGTRRLDRIKAMFQEHVDAQLGDEPAELIRDDIDLPVI